VLGVAQALATIGVQEVRRRHVAGADGGIGLQGNADQAQLQQARPTGPAMGTILTRRYKGRTIQVEVLEHGFAYDDQVYRSLSALAKAVTGSHCSGHFFFGLTEKGPNA
jgi:hypothetical protein